MDSSNLAICLRKGNSGEVENFRMCFKRERELNAQKNATSGQGKKKRV